MLYFSLFEARSIKLYSGPDSIHFIEIAMPTLGERDESFAERVSAMGTKRSQFRYCCISMGGIIQVGTALIDITLVPIEVVVC